MNGIVTLSFSKRTLDVTKQRERERKSEKGNERRNTNANANPNANGMPNFLEKRNPIATELTDVLLLSRNAMLIDHYKAANFRITSK